MPLMHADGLLGEVRVAGRVAAGLANWSMRPVSPDQVAVIREWVVRATLVDPVDLYLEAGRPLEVRLFISKTIWRWRGCDLTERNGPGVTLIVHGDSETM